MRTNKSIDLQVDEFKHRLVDEINSCGLPLCLIDYVTTEIANQIKMEYISTVQNERLNLDEIPKPEVTGTTNVDKQQLKLLKEA